MFAAGTGQVSGLQVLLDEKANPNVEDSQATTTKKRKMELVPPRFHVGLQFFCKNQFLVGV